MRYVLLIGVVASLSVSCSSYRARSDFSITADWQDFDSIDVRTTNGAVDLTVADVPMVRVSGTKSVEGNTREEAERNLEDIEVVVEPVGGNPGTLLVAVRHPERLRHESPGARIVVELPAPCAATVRTHNGAIRARGLRGDVRLHTSNGKIEVEDVVGDAWAKTSNGAIHVAAVEGSLDARTSNGKIEADLLPPVDGYVVLHTSNGSIHVTLPADLPADLRLDASNGSVRTQYETLVLRGSHATSKTWGVLFEELEASVHGGGCRVEAVTINGSIALDCRHASSSPGAGTIVSPPR